MEARKISYVTRSKPDMNMRLGLKLVF
jgi:hypothetical protein